MTSSASKIRTCKKPGCGMVFGHGEGYHNRLHHQDTVTIRANGAETLLHRDPLTKEFDCLCLNFAHVDPDKLRVSNAFMPYQPPYTQRIHRFMPSLVVAFLRIHHHRTFPRTTVTTIVFQILVRLKICHYQKFPTTTTIVFQMRIRSRPHPNSIYPPSTLSSIRSSRPSFVFRVIVPLCLQPICPIIFTTICLP